MRYFVSLIIIGLFVVSSFAQDTSTFLRVERVSIYSTTFDMVNETSKGPKLSDYKFTPPTESELEDRKFSSIDTQIKNNQHLSVSFSNLSGKNIKSVSFVLLLSENGKKYFEKKVKDKPRITKIGSLYNTFYISEGFFSTKKLSNPNLKKEIIIRGIEFTDGTKLKF